ncbi:MAG: helix-turn-helix domain-containing protein [Ruminococcus sp.]|nr:helix-turn-helix domain-containing protein [Ruminococcus sp.]
MWEYIIKSRINVALQLLRYTDFSVGEISRLSGYENHNAFCRTFRQYMETSPTQYRKTWRGLGTQPT